MRKVMLLSGCLLTATVALSQTVVSTEAVYGGRMNNFVAYSTASTAARVFVATESANSIFYSDATIPMSGTPTFSNFQVLGCAGSDDNLGSGISRMAAHGASTTLFFVANTSLYQTISPYSSASLSGITNVADIVLANNTLIALNDATTLRWGTVDASGVITPGGMLTVAAFASLNNPRLFVGQSDNRVYCFAEGTSPKLYRSSDTYTSLSNTTTFSEVILTSLSTAITWKAAGQAPDGRLFVGGHSNTKHIAYSDDSGSSWTSVNTGLSGVSGLNFDFYRQSSSSSSYYVYFAKGYSSDKGSTWAEFGNVSQATHPNDGAVLSLAGTSTGATPSIVLMTTDQGLGKSFNGGSIITENNDKIEAVQVEDFDMNSAKTHGWLASKAGIRLVSNFNTASPSWSNAMFPNGDGSPYYSAEMIANNTNEAFVGNIRVYKTTNGGSNWTQVFTAENAPYNFSGMAAVKAIEVHPTNTNLVMAGYNLQVGRGGLFYSLDGGASWAQLLINAASVGQDVNVNDIIMNTEGGNPVAYIGVEYNTTPNITAIYKTTYSGGAWSTPTQNMSATDTDLGYAYQNSIEDLHVASSTFLLASGGSTSSPENPNCYFRDLAGTNKWKAYPAAGMATTGRVTNVTIGGDTVFASQGTTIYWRLKNNTTGAWGVYYTYPNGTNIRVLYYDELLVGTATGFQNVRHTSPASPLPVEMVYFSAQWVENKVVLNWETAQSQHSKGFVIERAAATTPSVHSATWEEIGFVADQNNTQNIAKYIFEDKNIKNNLIYYYRLKQVDNNNDFELSKIISIQTGGNAIGLNIKNYPNPFSNNTTIEYTLPQNSDATIWLIDMSGKTLRTWYYTDPAQGTYNIELNDMDLPNGVYWCRIQQGNNYQQCKMIVYK